MSNTPNEVPRGWVILQGLMIGIGLTCAGLDAIMHMYGWCAFMLAAVIVQLSLMGMVKK
jgi:hypothetical protein